MVLINRASQATTYSNSDVSSIESVADFHLKFADKMGYYDYFDNFYETNNSSFLSEMIAEYEIEELEKHIEIIENKEKASSITRNL